MKDWYEYVVTTRTGPGPLERPAGDGWELHALNSTAPAVQAQTQQSIMHHSVWKRVKRQEPAGHKPLHVEHPAKV